MHLGDYVQGYPSTVGGLRENSLQHSGFQRILVGDGDRMGGWPDVLEPDVASAPADNLISETLQRANETVGENATRQRLGAWTRRTRRIARNSFYTSIVSGGSKSAGMSLSLM